MSTESLQDYIFVAKYARTVNGKKETWNQAVSRVMGMHEEFLTIRHGVNMEDLDPYFEAIRKAYHKQEMLGAQRALQWGGSQLLKHHFRMYNCFRRDTKFVTNEGVKSFEDFEDGDNLKVLTHAKNWKNAIVRNYGTAAVNEITVKRGASKSTIYSTGNHRWIKNDGVITEDLQINDKLLRTPRYFQEFNYDTATPFEKLYWCYGMVYGDGTRIQDKGGNLKYSLIRLCGEDKQFSDRFESCGFKTSTNLSLKGDCIAYTGSYLKTSPDPSVDSPELIRAFVSGYLQADAYKNSNPNTGSRFIDIQSSEIDHIEFIRKCFPIAGVYIVSEKNITGEKTNLGTRPYTIKFRLTQGQGSMAPTFKVASIKREVEICDVWCLEVEDDQSFMLPNGLATGNCASSYANRVDFFHELMYVLLCGAGVGYSVQKHHVGELPVVQGPLKEKVPFVIGDSIEGWGDSVKALMYAFFYNQPLPQFDGTQVRPKGAMISGGFKAPGPDPLLEALKLVKVILNNAIGRKLRPLEVHEIACIFADAVISGGVRRSALLSLFSIDDEEMMSCKTGDWWTKKEYLARANNSAAVFEDTPYESYKRVFENAKAFGEPGIVFLKHRDQILNPCAEISMFPVWVNEDGSREYGFAVCNLTEINGAKIKSLNDFKRAAFAASAMGTIQASYTDFPYLGRVTEKIIRRDALIGVGITGMSENPYILFDPENQRAAAKVVVQTNKEVADIIGINYAARTTTIKPSGTSSSLLGTSPGIHPFDSMKYVRHVQANKDEQAWQVLKEFNPKVVEASLSNNRDVVISFPVEKESGVLTKNNLSALEFMELVKLTQNNWIAEGTNWDHSSYKISPQMTHNVSNTISVKDHEWENVQEYLWKNKAHFCGVSFLSDSGSLDYVQAPFSEVIDEKALAEKYGAAAILAGGLNVDGIHAFGDLWRAISCAQGIGESLVFEKGMVLDVIEKNMTDFTRIDERLGITFNFQVEGAKITDVSEIANTIINKLQVKRDWMRRFKAFAHKYLGGDLVKTGYCLKQVSLLHKWYQVKDQVPVNWNDVQWEDAFKDAGSDVAANCAGNACVINI